MKLTAILDFLPEVKKPTEKRLSFSTKLKWSLIILGAKFGTIASLGIGPIVTASIVLQLLVGAGLLKLDTTSPEGRALFQGIQKILIIFFIIFEAMVYVLMGG